MKSLLMLCMLASACGFVPETVYDASRSVCRCCDTERGVSLCQCCNADGCTNVERSCEEHPDRCDLDAEDPLDAVTSWENLPACIPEEAGRVLEDNARCECCGAYCAWVVP